MTRPTTGGGCKQWGNGYLHIPDLVLNHHTDKGKALDPITVRLYLHILNLSEEMGIYYQSNPNAAQALGLGSCTIKRHKAQLVNMGWLKLKFPGGYKAKRTQQGEPFVRVPREWVNDLDLSAYDFRLLIEYVRHPDWRCAAWYLAAACGMSAQQVGHSRRHLLELGRILTPTAPCKGRIPQIDVLTKTTQELDALIGG